MKFGRLGFLTFTLVASLSVTACGQNGSSDLIRGAQFKTSQDAGGLFGELDLTLNTGSLLLPTFELPILNPRKPGAIYGSISMRDGLSLGTELGLKVNLTEVAKAEALDGSQLPNGKAIPVALGSVKPIGFSVQDRSRVYLAFGNGMSLVGTAIVIPAFDNISKYVAGLDLFLPFQGTNGIRGVAGIFTSLEPSKSGIAVFVDVSSILNQKPTSAGSLAAASVRSGSSSKSSSTMRFRSGGASADQMLRMNQAIQELSSAGDRLTLQ